MLEKLPKSLFVISLVNNGVVKKAIPLTARLLNVYIIPTFTSDEESLLFKVFSP